MSALDRLLGRFSYLAIRKRLIDFYSVLGCLVTLKIISLCDCFYYLLFLFFIFKSFFVFIKIFVPRVTKRGDFNLKKQEGKELARGESPKVASPLSLGYLRGKPINHRLTVFNKTDSR